MIPYSCQRVDEDDIAAVVQALKGEFLTGGTTVEAFENALAQYLHVKHVVVLNSATSVANSSKYARARSLARAECGVRTIVVRGGTDQTANSDAATLERSKWWPMS